MKIVKTISFFCFFAFLAVACNNKMEDEFTSVTREELLTLFNFDTQKDVYENIQSLNSFNKNKQYRVNGKSITINKLIPEEMDAELGTFILAVEGTVNGTPFSERLEFKGFNPPKTEKGEEDINEEEHEKEEEKEEDYTVSEEEIISLFILDRNGTVDNAIAELEQFKGHKHINGKEITIDAIEVIRQDNKTGDFTLLVKGNADGKKDFELTLDFTGFAPCEEEVVANKPSDYNMAERAYVQIAEGKNIYDANFDGFYRENKKDEFALQLKDFLTISSSGNDGIPYLYDQEDLRHTSLTVIGYDKWEKELSLTVTYKEYTSQELSIPFDHNEYYKTLVSVNTEETGQYYQSGVLHYMKEFGGGGYLFSRFIKARNGFLVEYLSSNKTGESINYSVRLLDSGNNREVASFDVVVGGFKDLKNLETELIITGGDYSDFVSEKLDGNASVEEIVKRTFNQHVTELSFSYKGITQLSYNSSGPSLYSDDEKSLYFNEVIMEYHSMEKDVKGDMTLNIKLSSVNGKVINAIIPVKHFLTSGDLNK